MTICTKRDCKIEKLTLVSDKAYKKMKKQIKWKYKMEYLKSHYIK